MRFTDKIRDYTYPIIPVFLIASLWIFAWSASLQAQATPGYFPPLNPRLSSQAVEVGMDPPPTSQPAQHFAAN